LPGNLDSLNRLRAVFDRWEGNSAYYPYYYNGTPFIEYPELDTAIIIMPKQNIAIKGLYREEKQYRLQLIGGIPENSYHTEGEKLIIDASKSSLKKFFRWKWTNDTVSVNVSNYLYDVYSAVTTFTQPSRDVSLSAVYLEILDSSLHELKVNSGWIQPGGVLDLSGAYSTANLKSNAKVKLVAFEPGEGSVFNVWLASNPEDYQYISDQDSMITYITIPDGSASKPGLEFTATYHPAPDRFSVKIDGGTCDACNPIGYFRQGDTVLIGAVDGFDKRFYKWLVLDYNTGDSLRDYESRLFDPFAHTTSLIMPGKNLLLVAQFKPRTYKLMVYGGSGSGDYKIGTKVPISPINPAAGLVFSHWDAENSFSLITPDSTVSNAEVNMTSKDLLVKAVFISQEVSKVALNVYNGSGSGLYNKGSQIAVAALLPAQA